MAGTALKRLLAEFKQLTEEPLEGIVAGPVSGDNFLEWEVFLTGPDGTSYEGGVFPARLIFPPDYPMKPPQMRFSTEMFHPNIYPDGRVCIPILRALGADLTGYEDYNECWNPALSIGTILFTVVALLAEPNENSPANVDAATMWRDKREEYDKHVKSLARKTLGLPD